MKKGSIILILIFVLFACSKKSETSSTVSPKSNTPAPQETTPLEEINSKRTEWQNPELVISMLGDLAGQTVLDIGAGAGYFTFKIADKAQKVIALDIDPKALEYIKDQKQILGGWTDNIEARLTPPDVPNLLPNEVDKALIVNTYNFLPDRMTYLPRLLEGMKPDALLVVVDFKKGNIPVGPSDDFKLDPTMVRRELRKAGFKQINIDSEMLTYQYIVTAKKK